MDGQISFTFEQRQPIKGYPELHWTGREPMKRNNSILLS